MIPHLLFAGWLATCTADASTTHLGLRAGAHESLLTQNPWANDTLIGGEAAAVGYELLVLPKQGHPRLAFWLGVAFTSYRASVAWHNWSVYQQQQAINTRPR